MSSAPESKGTRTRSPAYPAIDLEKAIERAAALYKAERKNSVPVEVAVKHWNYEPGSSGGNRVVSALKQFGLLVEEGKNNNRHVKLTPLAIELSMPEEEGSEVHLAHLKQAALSPPIHAAILGKYDDGLPSDAALKRYLLVERNFNEDAVDTFIKQFRSTIAFSKALDAGIMPENEDKQDDSDKEGDEVEAVLESPLKDPKKLPPVPAGQKDFPLYTATAKGSLYVPAKMSKADFDLLKRQIESCLIVIEATSIEDDGLPKPIGPNRKPIKFGSNTEGEEPPDLS